MDWADDVAYSVHDLEDGLHGGLITLDELRDPAQRREVAELTAAEYCAPGSVSADELGEIFDRLLAHDFWPQRFDGGPQHGRRGQEPDQRADRPVLRRGAASADPGGRRARH